MLVDEPLCAKGMRMNNGINSASWGRCGSNLLNSINNGQSVCGGPRGIPLDLTRKAVALLLLWGAHSGDDDSLIVRRGEHGTHGRSIARIAKKRKSVTPMRTAPVV